MTIQEAIEWQKAFKRTYKSTPSDVDDACDMAISALKEQLPKKPIVIENVLYNHYKCPRYNDYICVGDPQCLKCEQVLDWSDTD